MAEQKERFDWICRLSLGVLVAALVLLTLAMIATVAQIVMIALDTPTFMQLAPWVLAVLIEALLCAMAFILYGLVRVVVLNERAVDESAGRLGRIETLLESQGQALDRLIELSSISDQARSLIFRDREIEAFREVIHEDLMRQDYKTAEALIDTIEEKFGYADEAARLREEAAESRKATVEEKIDGAIGRINAILERHAWARALREAQRLGRMFPDHEKVQALPERVQNARTAHKRRLLQEYDEAVKKNDVERGVELLQELDPYLTPQEGAALAESARGVFRAKLHNLGVQFAIHVTDEQWSKAVATGEQIVRDYPNSRMAHEVRSKMDQLRSLAAGVQRER